MERGSVSLYKICKKCGRMFSKDQKMCLVCGCKMKLQYTDEELEKIEKQNEDMTVIHTMLLW